MDRQHRIMDHLPRIMDHLPSPTNLGKAMDSQARITVLYLKAMALEIRTKDSNW
jgi:hypothetical protein